MQLGYTDVSNNTVLREVLDEARVTALRNALGGQGGGLHVTAARVRWQ